MNKLHQEILNQLKTLSSKQKIDKHPDNYSGSKHFAHNIKTGDVRQLCRDFLKNHQDLTLEEFINLLDSLSMSESHTEKMIVGKLIGYSPKLRSQIDPSKLDTWLEHLNGWAEVDSLCQSNFTYKNLLDNWEKWKRLLEKFVRDKNIPKRRASLVLLTGVVSHSDDKRLSKLAFQNIDRLKNEKDILITKATSWLLRDLIKLHKKEVEEYLEKNKSSLPKIAIRETQRKLLTGKK